MGMTGRVVFGLGAALLGWHGLAAQEPARSIQGEAAEQFLTTARITRMVRLQGGATAPRRATLDLDGVTHDALFQTIEYMRRGLTQLTNGTVVSNMRDNWRFEIAAYQIDRVIGLGMVPATVERQYRGQSGSLQQWVEGMSEAERLQDAVEPPVREDWHRQLLKMHLFDNLIDNWDRSLPDIRITKEFQLRLIDHSRSFLLQDELRKPANLGRFSRSLLAGLERLERDDLRERIGDYLTDAQIDAVLARRDAILDLAKTRVAEWGEDNILYP